MSAGQYFHDDPTGHDPDHDVDPDDDDISKLYGLDHYDSDDDNEGVSFVIPNVALSLWCNLKIQ